MTDPSIEFSRELTVTDIPTEGTAMDVEATPLECARLAGRFGVVRVIGFRARIEARRWRGSGVAISGAFEGEVEQTCVLSLEPVVNTIADSFEVRYVRPERTAQAAEDEGVVEPCGEDEPEELRGSKIDIGDLAAEHAILAIDPYPRRDDAEPPVDARGQEAGAGGDGGDNPFAALADLKEKLGKL